MFVITNYDYEDESVSNVYGPFKTRDEAQKRMEEMASAEFERLKNNPMTLDVEMFDDEPGEVEIVYDQDNDNGCLYQVLEVEK